MESTMSNDREVRACDVLGIDLCFRPRSYFWPLEVETHLLARIKGAQRRAELQSLLTSGPHGDIPDLLAKSGLSESERQVLGQVHPAFMGGEYLPDLAQSEVEIARITIASVTQDVTSVVARRGKHRIYYRVVDEYGGETLAGVTRRTSNNPLTMAQLETFFNGAWSIFDVLDMNFADNGYPTAAIRAFVAASSCFYPQLGSLYAQRIAAWVRERRREHGLDSDGAAESCSNEDAAADSV
jgi:hypothetical protein